MGLFESLIVAEERIDFQKDTFGLELEKQIGQIGEDIRSGLAKKNLNGYPVVKKIEDMIFKRMGLRVNLITNSHLAAIYPFYSNKNHIFLNELIRGHLSIPEQNKAIKKFETPNGKVNLSTAKVEGIFSEYVHPLYINFHQFFDEGFESSEITACMLHELGHGFSACYYSDRADRTNQVLANVHRTIIGTRTDKDIDYIYREISKITDRVKKEEVDTMLNGGRVVAGATWFKMVVRAVQSQMLDDQYNNTAFEESSDSFAGRFGYGKSLTMALDKVHKDDFNKSKSALMMAYIADFMFIAAVAGMVLVGLTSGVLLASFIGITYSSAYISFSGEDSIDYTYDDLKNRHKRIRMNIIEELKDSELDPKTIKTILDNIYAVDAAIESTYQFRNLGTKINNLIFGSSRSALQNIEAQQLIEALSANDLFIKAAEFKTI